MSWSSQQSLFATPTSAEADGEGGNDGPSPSDMLAPDFSYAFLKGLETITHNRPKSVEIPPSVLENMGNMERQYWEIKAPHFDIVVFFKKGKFYELYDCDAVIAHREFGLKLVCDSSNRGKMRMAGVPEQSFTEWARLFVFRGYKIGRVEQLNVGAGDEDGADSPAGKAPPVKLKITPRELVQIITGGTISDPGMLTGDDANILVAIVPVCTTTTTGTTLLSAEAVAVDISRNVVLHCPCPGLGGPASSTGDGGGESPSVQATRVLDAVQCLLLHLNPREIIVPSCMEVCSGVGATGTTATAQTGMDELLAGLKQLVRNGFATATSSDVSTEEVTPEILAAHTTAKKGTSSASVSSGNAAQQLLSAYFTSLMLNDFDWNAMHLFTDHLSGAAAATIEAGNLRANASVTSGSISAEAAQASLTPLAYERKFDRGLHLDSSAIENLEVVANLRDGTQASSLLSRLGTTSTATGRRTMRSWVLRPLSNAVCIGRRQACIKDDILGCQELQEVWVEAGGKPMGGLYSPASQRAKSTQDQLDDSPKSNGPGKKRGRVGARKCLFSLDMERQLSRLVQLKSENANINYADPLVLYRGNFTLLMDSLFAFDEMVELAVFGKVAIEKTHPLSPLMAELLEKLKAPASAIKAVKSQFNLQDAIEDEKIVPTRGMIPSYDAAMTRMEELSSKFFKLIKSTYAPMFGVEPKAISYTDIGKDIFLLEVPLAAYKKAEKHVTETGVFEERARTTKVVKLICCDLRDDIDEYKKCDVVKASGLKMALRHLAGVLCEQYVTLFEAVQAFSYLDCLFSLASLTTSVQGPYCFPSIVASESTTTAPPSFITATGLYHCMVPNVVSNDVSMDNSSGRIILLTGPNMAGKSTLMRTVALGFLLAQLGGPVCASSMTFYPVGRVFTRIGARDAQHRGHSTLYVELKETADICNASNQNSLCLVDELGRGTSTHDGHAVAHATLKYLSGRVGRDTTTSTTSPLVVFSTHYHTLASDIHAEREKAPQGTSNIQLAYMDFALTTTSTNSHIQRVSFLYKVVPGVCSRSYGVEVAASAGIPMHLLTIAQRMSKQLAHKSELHHVGNAIRVISAAVANNNSNDEGNGSIQ